MDKLNFELVYVGYSEAFEGEAFALMCNGQRIEQMVYAPGTCFIAALNHAIDELIDELNY